MNSRLRLAPGRHVYKLNAEEVAVGGGGKTIYLRGPAELLMSFLASFERGVCSVQDSLDRVEPLLRSGGQRDLAIQGLQVVAEQLSGARVLLPEEPVGRRPRFERLAWLCGEPAPLIPAACFEIGVRESRLLLLPGAGSGPEIEAGRDAGGGVLTVHRVSNLLSLTANAVLADCDLLIAWGLSEAELHTVNQAMLRSGLPWMFFGRSDRRSVISPVLRRGATPCYACFRLRRLGTSPDVVPNAVIEARMIKGLPDLATPPDPSVPTRLIATALVLAQISAAEGERQAFTFVSSPWPEIGAVDLLQIPNCPVCAEVAV